MHVVSNETTGLSRVTRARHTRVVQDDSSAAITASRLHFVRREGHRALEGAVRAPCLRSDPSSPKEGSRCSSFVSNSFCAEGLARDGRSAFSWTACAEKL